MKRFGFFAMILSSWACNDTPSAPPATAPMPPAAVATGVELPEPSHLSETVRSLLTAQMQRHVLYAQDLQEAVLTLDFEAAAQAAERLSTEPRLARPTQEDATLLNTRLPEPFFELQRNMVQRAEVVARTAAQENPRDLARAYGELSAACVQCHALYLLPADHQRSGGEGPDR